ncbi:MAG: hypothetical protein ACUVRK_09715 [Spirochaetota bacterium]
MNFKYYMLLLAIVPLMMSSCGILPQDEVSITGTVTIDPTMPRSASAQVFVAVATTSDIDAVMNDPVHSIVTIIEPSSDGTYTVQCSDYGLHAGDEIFLFAFIDNDYSGGIPFPTPGDLLGFYTNGFKLSYTVGVDGNADITINRQQYDFSATVIGSINGNDSGSVILIAYAGDFNSSNITNLDINKVVGYKKIKKSAYPCNFELPIMPYGYNVPLGGVYVIALLDANNNSIPDEGDMIGFATEAASNTPTAVTITQGVTLVNPIRFILPIYGEPQTQDPPLTLSGTFDAPAGYSSDPQTKPIFIVVAKGSDPNEVFANIQNLNTQTFDFTRVEQGQNTFALTLSRSKFTPGDTVFVIALWDKDFISGLPNATEGDTVGFIMNKSTFTYAIPLQEGENTIIKNNNQYYVNGTSGYSFALERTVYNHNAVIRLKLERGNATTTQFANGTKVICVAVYETQNIAQLYSKNGYYEIDMDKIIAVADVRIAHDEGSDITGYYSMPIMPALHQSIPATQDGELYIDNVWVLAVLDSNGNGKPDNGERIGFYWDYFLFYYPIKLPVPLGDGTTYLNKTVRFSTYTY